MNCPKCGHSVIKENYHDGCERAYHSHMHNRCLNCRYSWMSPTMDELDKIKNDIEILFINEATTKRRQK